MESAAAVTETEAPTTAGDIAVPTEEQHQSAEAQAASAPDISEDGNVVSRMFERDVTISLSDEQLADMLCEAGRIQKEINDLKEQRKQVNQRLKDKQGALEEIFEQADNGEKVELRMVKEVRDYRECTIKILTGPNYDQVVEERTMQGDELQKDLFVRRADGTEAVVQETQAENPELPISEPTDPAADLNAHLREERNVSTKTSAVDGPTH